jgi:ABC-type multidrug transport system fused ATPase/permease subunit
MAILIGVVYAFSTERTVDFNRGYNDEYERQVDVLQRNDSALTRRHVGLMNGWSIRLSDLDATNYAISLALTIALQVFAIIVSAGAGMDAGSLLSVVLYVFEFSAVASFLPNSWQEYLRLRDILQRLQQT